MLMLWAVPVCCLNHPGSLTPFRDEGDCWYSLMQSPLPSPGSGCPLAGAGCRDLLRHSGHGVLAHASSLSRRARSPEAQDRSLDLNALIYKRLYGALRTVCVPFRCKRAYLGLEERPVRRPCGQRSWASGGIWGALVPLAVGRAVLSAAVAARAAFPQTDLAPRRAPAPQKPPAP